MLDFHTHILPGIDDGSTDEKTSVEMIKMLYEQGVSMIVLTPHFYQNEMSFEIFSKKRKESLESLLCEIGKSDIEKRPDFAIGAEVSFFYGLDTYQYIEELCIEGTKFLLVEMPFERWNLRMYETLNRLKKNKDITPIIAHIERYTGFNSKREMIRRFIEIGAFVQANTNFFNSYVTRLPAFNMLKNGFIQYIGTDCHNLNNRKPDYDEFLNLIKKKNNGMYINDLMFWEDVLKKNGAVLY